MADDRELLTQWLTRMDGKLDDAVLRLGRIEGVQTAQDERLKAGLSRFAEHGRRLGAVEAALPSDGLCQEHHRSIADIWVYVNQAKAVATAGRGWWSAAHKASQLLIPLLAVGLAWYLGGAR